MKWKSNILLITTMLVLPLIAGCLPSEPAGDNPPSGNAEDMQTPGQIVSTLKEMSLKPMTQEDLVQRYVLTAQLAYTGPRALTPLVDYMGAPDTEPQARLFMLQCINDFMTAAYIADLKPLIESGSNVVRACGISALGNIKHESVTDILQAACNDVSANVRFSALSGLAMQGNEDALSEFKAMYTGDVTMGEIPLGDVKREVIRVLLRDPKEEDLPLFEDALNRDFLKLDHRSMIVHALGRMGDGEDIVLLEQAKNMYADPEYGEMVDEAIAAIKEREDIA